MSNKLFGILVFNIMLSIILFLIAITFMIIAKDLSEKIVIEEQRIEQLENGVCYEK